MKSLFFTVLLISYFNLIAKPPNISEVRILFKKAATESGSCKKLLSVLKLYNENNNPLLAGYKACATMMMANYVINPYSKISSFSEGKTILEKCIKEDKENLELRFLRFSVQTKAPSFLGYSSSIKSDKLFLLSSLSSISDLELKTLVVAFLKNSDFLTVLEKQKINK